MAGSRALHSLPETPPEVTATGDGSPPAARGGSLGGRVAGGMGPSAALPLLDDGTTSTPPRAWHPHRKTLSRDRPDFHHGLLEHLRATLPTALRARLHTAGDLARTAAETRTAPALPTALEGLDRLLAGGLPRGGLTELVGRRSSGRFSTVLSALAAATAAGEAAALIDLGDGLDPQSAATAGVVLERLLRTRPRHLKEALISAEMLLDGGFSLVVLDLGTPPVPGGRGPEASWLRLARAARSQRATLLVSSPYRVSGTNADVVVQAVRGHPLWHGGTHSSRLLTGIASRLTLERLQGQHARATGQVRFTAAGEIDP